ncbi:MAG: ion channel [Thermodesulfobacteriota bacterium]
MISSLLARLKHLRFFQLTIFFIFVLLTLPFRTEHPFFNIVIQLLLFNSLVVTLSASGSSRTLRWLLVLFWTLGEGLHLRGLFILGPGSHLLNVSLVVTCFMLMMAVCVGAILLFIFKTHRVTLDTIFAALMAYFFISSIFANIYSLLYLMDPNSFNLPPAIGRDQFYAVYTEMIYFSLITVVGAGYGDIVPLLPFPRLLAAMEAVLGHFYVAVFVAWLVGTFISQSIQQEEKQAPEVPKEPMND